MVRLPSQCNVTMSYSKQHEYLLFSPQSENSGAALRGHRDIVKLFPRKDCDPNIASKGGCETALTAVIVGGRPGAERALNAAGAALNMKRMRDNRTPIGVAS